MSNFRRGIHFSDITTVTRLQNVQPGSKRAQIHKNRTWYFGLRRSSVWQKWSILYGCTWKGKCWRCGACQSWKRTGEKKVFLRLPDSSTWPVELHKLDEQRSNVNVFDSHICNIIFVMTSQTYKPWIGNCLLKLQSYSERSRNARLQYLRDLISWARPQ